MRVLPLHNLVALIFTFFILLTAANAKNISVSILGGEDLSHFTITIKRGNYSLINQNTVYTLFKGNQVVIQRGGVAIIGDTIQF